MADRDHLEHSVADFLSEVAAATPAPGAGAVAATVVALAAGLTAMSAGLSHRRLPDAEELTSRAVELQERAKPLARRDGNAYADVLAAKALPEDDPGRATQLEAALATASDVPLEIAAVGMAVLDLAVDLARRGNPNLRGDALTACLLAQSAVRAAAALVELNIAADDDSRRVRAAELVDAAGEVSLTPEALWGR